MTREQAIQSLVNLDRPLPLLKAELAQFPWDWEGEPLAILDDLGVKAVLQRYIAGELTDEQVEAWADLVEARDDIEFDGNAADAIFCLANPVINGPLVSVVPMLLGRL